MLAPNLVGRQLIRVSGPTLVWVSVADVQFVDLDKTKAIPLFLDDEIDGGRFFLEIDGWLSIPVDADYRTHDTGEPYTTFRVPDRITPAELL